VTGDYGTVLISSDGVNWTNEPTYNRSFLAAVAYGGGWFVAVGSGAVSSSGQNGAPLQLSGDAILSSETGEIWSIAQSGKYSGLSGVTFGDDRFVAVGGNGTILTWSPTPSSIDSGLVLDIGSRTVYSLWGTNAGELPVPPVISDGHTFVPLDFAAAQLGCKVQWEPSSRQIVISFQDTTVVMTGDQRVYTLNGEVKEMDVAPFIADPGYTMVPLRFVAQALGDEVQWNPSNDSVIIGTPSG
jgi:hypothetical protein